MFNRDSVNYIYHRRGQKSAGVYLRASSNFEAKAVAQESHATHLKGSQTIKPRSSTIQVCIDNLLRPRFCRLKTHQHVLV